MTTKLLAKIYCNFFHMLKAVAVFLVAVHIVSCARLLAVSYQPAISPTVLYEINTETNQTQLIVKTDAWGSLYENAPLAIDRKRKIAYFAEITSADANATVMILNYSIHIRRYTS
jgi:hypothetical protein